jgi:CubicO group peptidase (beta-lactamase class C family)
MLLNHTSGITNYTSIPGVWQSFHYKYSTDSLIRLFKDKPYDFPPGKGWNYSNSGYYLLGMIIEKASGKKYADYLREQIIIPLQMKNTDVERLDTVYALKARGYSRRGKHWQPADFMELEGAWAAGAMLSTVEDLHIWIKALYENRVLSAASTRKMLTPDPGTNGYGYGIISDSLGKYPRIWHNGGIHGFTSYLAYFPGSDVTVVSLCNNDGDNADRVATALSRIAFNEKVTPPYIPKEVKIDPAILNSYAGKYKGGGDPLELVVVNGKLYRRRAGAPDVELKPESNTRFFYADMSDRFIEFKTEGGKRKSYLTSGGQTIELVPITN